MNIERLNQVKQHILDHPEQFDMRDFIINTNKYPNREWNCDTAYCIGGTAVKLFNDVTTVIGKAGKAQDILDLTHSQATTLFYRCDDPSNPFKDIWYHNNPHMSDEDRAQLAAKRIEHFIATDGCE